MSLGTRLVLLCTSSHETYEHIFQHTDSKIFDQPFKTVYIFIIMTVASANVLEALRPFLRGALHPFGQINGMYYTLAAPEYHTISFPLLLRIYVNSKRSCIHWYYHLLQFYGSYWQERPPLYALVLQKVKVSNECSSKLDNLHINIYIVG